MASKLGLTLIAGAVALATSGMALANDTTAGAGSVGTVFLNIVDSTNNSSFFFDTGDTVSNFPFTGTFSASLSGDANYQAFVAGEGVGDVVTYSIIAGHDAPGTATAYFTAGAAPAANVGNKIAAGESQIGTFLAQINGFSSSTTNSAYVTGGGASDWGTYEPTFNSDFKTTDGASIGNTLSFFSELTNNPSSTLIKGTVSTFTGTWDLTSAGLLTYTNAAAVPLPAPLLLLLSGIGLMGLISRRRPHEGAVDFGASV